MKRFNHLKKDDWFYVTRKKVQNEILISEHIENNCVEKLRMLGLIDFELREGNRRYFKILMDKVLNFIETPPEILEGERPKSRLSEPSKKLRGTPQKVGGHAPKSAGVTPVKTEGSIPKIVRAPPEKIGRPSNKILYGDHIEDRNEQDDLGDYNKQDQAKDLPADAVSPSKNLFAGGNQGVEAPSIGKEKKISENLKSSSRESFAAGFEKQGADMVNNKTGIDWTFIVEEILKAKPEKYSDFADHLEHRLGGLMSREKIEDRVRKLINGLQNHGALVCNEDFTIKWSP